MDGHSSGHVDMLWILLHCKLTAWKRMHRRSVKGNAVKILFEELVFYKVFVCLLAVCKD